MELSDQQEAVKVTLCIEDWAVIVFALSASDTPLEIKERLNRTIFDSARDTERVLS